jgi:prepilin-type processing-associated H-X9-DG protein
MAILLTCACGRQFLTAKENRGRHARCPGCARELVIPEAGPPVESAEPVGSDSIPSLTCGYATASLVLGLLSLFCAVFAGLPAIVLGCRGLGEIKKGRGWMRGRAAAQSGIALGLIGSTFVTPVLVLPVFRAAREWVRERRCTDNLKQIALAMHVFHDTHGAFPPAAIVDRQGRPLLSWRVAILPGLGPEGVALYREFRLNEPWDSPHNRPLLDRMPEVYACPDEPRGRPLTTNYLVVVGPGRVFTGGRQGVKIEQLTGGTSNTLMVFESDRSVPWTAPEEASAAPSGEGPDMGSRHPGGYHIAMADGSVRYLAFP